MKTIKNYSTKKSRIIVFGLFLTIFFQSNVVLGQDIEVQGIINGKTFDKIEVLNGANIFLKGTNKGTSSNKKGAFKFPMKLKVGDVLEVSYLGFITQKIRIKASSSFLNITLQEDDNQMLGAVNSNKRYKSKRHKE